MQYEMKFDEATQRSLFGEYLDKVFVFEQCEVCRDMYSVGISHRCKKKEITPSEVMRGMYCCTFAGCNKCPFKAYQIKLFNGRMALNSCKDYLAQNAKLLFSDHQEEVQNGHEDKNTSPHT